MYQADSKSFSRIMGLPRRKHETGIASLATPNTKVFFDHIWRNRHLCHQIGTLKTGLGVIVKESDDQAELFNSFYDTVFHPGNGNLSNIANSIGDDIMHSRVHPLSNP